MRRLLLCALGVALWPACGASAESPDGQRVTDDRFGSQVADTARPLPLAPADAAPPSDAAPKDDGSSAGAAVDACPAAPEGPLASGCVQRPVWARDMASGLCCRYDGPCQTPPGWPTFQNAEECETSCRCEGYTVPEGLDATIESNLDRRIERLSLDCECPNGRCPDQADQLATAGSALCDSFIPQVVLREQGCGMTAFRTLTGYGGVRVVFDTASGALIGRSASGDSPARPCGTFSRVAGVEFSCEDAQSCWLCGEWYLTTPPPPPCQ